MNAGNFGFAPKPLGGTNFLSEGDFERGSDVDEESSYYYDEVETAGEDESDGGFYMPAILKKIKTKKTKKGKKKKKSSKPMATKSPQLTSPYNKGNVAQQSARDQFKPMPKMAASDQRKAQTLSN